MYYIELSGTPGEIGEKHGEAYRDEIRKYYDFYCAQRNKTPDKLPGSVADYLKKHFAYLEEEILGIARGAGMKFEEILIYNHFNVLTGCTPIFFKNSDRGPLLAQNLDCGREEREATLVRKVKPKDGQSFICVSFVGTVWKGNGINESGFCAAAVSAHQKDFQKDNGTSGGIVGRHMLQYSKTVEDGFKLHTSYRMIGKIGVNLFADGTGNAALVEYDNKRKYIFPVKGNFAFSTGLYESDIEAKKEAAYLQPKYDRKATIKKLYENGEIEFTLAGMKKLLSHHCSPGPVCRHEPWEFHKNGDGDTQSARIMIINERKLLITDGAPCQSSFEEFSL